MQCHVRDLLNCLGRNALVRLAGIRSVGAAKSLENRRTILDQSYDGDLAALVNNLRLEDLFDILENGVDIDGRDYIIPGLKRLPLSEVKAIANTLFVQDKKHPLLREVNAAGNDNGGVGNHTTSSMLSTRCIANGCQKLDMKRLQDELRQASGVSVASAFFDEGFFKRLFGAWNRNDSKRQVRLLFNQLSGKRLQEQIKTLNGISAQLRKKTDRVEVRLKREAGMFHSKLFLFEGDDPTAFVGSANATMAALERNEEILLHTREIDNLAKYFETVWTSADPIEQFANFEPAAKSLVNFFRTGVLFFRPRLSLQTTYNPFLKLFSIFSDAEKAALTKVRIPHSDLETGIGPFSIKRALQFDAQLDEVHETESPLAKNPVISAVAIETSLGYWVPTPLVDEFRNKCEDAAKGKRETYKRLRTAVEQKPRQDFRKDYEEYRSAVHNTLTRSGVDVERHLKKVGVDPFSDDNGFTHFMSTLRTKLEPEFISRLTSSYIDSRMPEIWDDEQAVLEFEKTFFEYLEFVADKVGKKPRVPSIIQSKCGYANGADAEEIQEALEIRLRKEGWCSADWQ